MLVLLSTNSIIASGNNLSPTPTPSPRLGNENEVNFAPFSNTNTGGALEATQEQMNYWAGQERMNPRMSALETEIVPFSTWHNLHPFTHFAQTAHNGNSNTCGIASVRMVHQWFRGWTPTQAQIINSPEVTLHPTGTYLSDLVRYLNNNGVFPYAAVFRANQSTMTSRLTSSLRSFNAPPIIGLNGRTDQGFPRNTGNHFVVSYSVLGNGLEFALADPAGQGSLRWYDVTAANLFRAYDNVNIGFAW